LNLWRNIVEENGGTMVGEEFIPLGVSQFGQSIQNIQAAKPGFVVTLLVGAAQASYYEQAAAAKHTADMAAKHKAEANRDLLGDHSYKTMVQFPAAYAPSKSCVDVADAGSSHGTGR
jgi:hypothetical protein